MSKHSHITITGLEVFRVRVNKRGNWTIPRLQTNAGISGIGDASQSGNDDESLGHLRKFHDLLKGRSIFDIEWYRSATAAAVAEGGQRAAVAASALEHCLWDIRGKAFGVPVYELFGGRVHDEIRQYANINRSTEPRTPDGFARMAESAVSRGFDAIKLAPFDEMPRGLREEAQIQKFAASGIACAEAVRTVLGPKRDLLIDVHSHFDREHGLELARRFEPLNLFWLEEVTPAKPVGDLAAINAAAKMPTAGGESIQGVKGFYPYIRAQAVDIVMPDIKVCGGMLELKKIAALAEGAGLLVSPHGPASPVGNVVAAHVAATLPNFNILEFSYGEVPWRADLIEPSEDVIQGRLRLSDRPGLGISLNEKVAKQYAIS
ncbi:MAG TPA: mandelate racemase/muconate lactonizing enzyme family protein [Bryobacteraceae bacterium]|nr:mandelate racemase/muconate lactonizing enzyme family protein [Bryobacteraceae bacterium]